MSKINLRQREKKIVKDGKPIFKTDKIETVKKVGNSSSAGIKSVVHAKEWQEENERLNAYFKTLKRKQILKNHAKGK